MEYKMEEKELFSGEKVKVLGPTYEEGKPEDITHGRWRDKLESREEKLKYLQTAERYWFSTEWVGSERRKNPA